MRVHPQGGARSVDRGKCGLGIEPRKRVCFGVPTASTCTEGRTEHIAIARGVLAPRGRRPHARTEAFRTGTGRSHVWPWLDGARVRAVNPKGARLRCTDVGSRTGQYVPEKRSNKGRCDSCQRRPWREGAWPRGICSDKTGSGHRAGKDLV